MKTRESVGVHFFQREFRWKSKPFKKTVVERFAGEAGEKDRRTPLKADVRKSFMQSLELPFLDEEAAERRGEKLDRFKLGIHPFEHSATSLDSHILQT